MQKYRTWRLMILSGPLLISLSAAIRNRSALDYLLVVGSIVMLIIASRDDVDNDSQRSPKLGRCLVRFAAKRVRENILGDLEEEFQEQLAGSGWIRARLWYYRQLWRSLRPFIAEAFRAILRRRSIR